MICNRFLGAFTDMKTLTSVRPTSIQYKLAIWLSFPSLLKILFTQDAFWVDAKTPLKYLVKLGNILLI